MRAFQWVANGSMVLLAWGWAVGSPARGAGEGSAAALMGAVGAQGPDAYRTARKAAVQLADQEFDSEVVPE